MSVFGKKILWNEDGYITGNVFALHGDYKLCAVLFRFLWTPACKSTWQLLFKNTNKNGVGPIRWNIIRALCFAPEIQAKFWDKTYKIYQYAEGNFNWATAGILIPCSDACRYT